MAETQMSKLSLSIATLLGADSRRDIESAISTIRDLYGFAHMTFLSVGISAGERAQWAFCTTYPGEWTSRYLERNYFRIDPVVAIYRTGFQPVDWASLAEFSDGAHELFHEALEVGIGRNGVTMPIRGPSGERSLFSVTSNLSVENWIELRRSTKHDLMLLSHYMHERFMAVTGTRSHYFRALSRRERECLQLLAGGVVPKRIAHRLHLSESAVRLYLASAKRKLDATTIYQAIARASTLELIEV